MAPMAETQAWPAALPAGRLWPQLLRQREQARLNGREARAPMKRPFMAAQRPSVSLGAWPRGPVVRVSIKQTYLPKGRAAGGGGAGGRSGEPTVPRPVARSQGPHFWLLWSERQSHRTCSPQSLSPPPSSILTSHLCPPSTPGSHTFYSWVPAFMPAFTPALLCLALLLPSFPPPQKGSAVGNPPEKCSCSRLPTRVGLGNPSNLSRHGGKQTRTGKCLPPSPWQLRLLGGSAGDSSSGSGSGPHMPWGGPRAGQEPGVPMSPCSLNQPCGGAGVSCDGQLRQARSPQSVQGHAVQASKAWGGGAEAAADGGRDSTVTNLEDWERHGPIPVSQVGEGRLAAEPVCCGPGAMEPDLDPAL